MTTAQTTPALRSRKLLLLMPLFLLPFLTLLFWAAGGGRNSSSTDETKAGTGLNTQLPDARLRSDNGTDKLSFYLQANRDSAKKAEDKERDPFWNNIAFDSSRSLTENGTGYPKSGGSYDPLPPSGSGWNQLDNNEAKVYQKMSRLNHILAGAEQTTQVAGITDNSRSVHSTPGSGNQKLQVLEQTMSQTGSDPELEQLNTMLDKIVAIQHPDTERSSGISDNEKADGRSLRVRNAKSSPASMLAAPVEKDKKAAVNKMRSAFYSESYMSVDTATGEGLNTFSALVPRAQTIVSGSTLQLQLLQDVKVGETVISKGNYLSGTAAISGERLLIKIKSIRMENNVFPVSLEVYDMDGLPGIHTPGSSTGEAVRESSGRLTNSLGLTSLDPSIGAQAAATGIEAAKSLMSKKVKLIKVIIPAGYRILLKDAGTN
ncbi:MAG: conjugative transposon protein TraM [Williamsia sp.]|nr:conjugative transposon protein TraM [Williamsia sp.]